MSQIAELELNRIGVEQEDALGKRMFVSGQIHRRLIDGRNILLIAVTRMGIDTSEPQPVASIQVRYMVQNWDSGGSYFNPREFDPTVGNLPDG